MNNCKMKQKKEGEQFEKNICITVHFNCFNYMFII